MTKFIYFWLNIPLGTNKKKVRWIHLFSFFLCEVKHSPCLQPLQSNCFPSTNCGDRSSGNFFFIFYIMSPIWWSVLYPLSESHLQTPLEPSTLRCLCCWSCTSGCRTLCRNHRSSAPCPEPPAADWKGAEQPERKYRPDTYSDTIIWSTTLLEIYFLWH